jgi:hypothetical protein
MEPQIAERLQFSACEALEFHSLGHPGKIEIIATKMMATSVISRSLTRQA